MGENSERDFKPSDVVKHFKRETLDEEQRKDNMYLYRIIGQAEHTETGEKLMCYQALYGEGKICARPFAMFMSEVDREKYPEIKQRYRFERHS